MQVVGYDPSPGVETDSQGLVKHFDPVAEAANTATSAGWVLCIDVRSALLTNCAPESIAYPEPSKVCCGVHSRVTLSVCVTVRAP